MRAESANNEVASVARAVCPVLIGTKIPEVTLRAVDGSAVNLSTVLKKPSVIVFYRGGW